MRQAKNELTLLEDAVDLLVRLLVDPGVDGRDGFLGLGCVELRGFRAEGTGGQLLVFGLQLQALGDVHLVGDFEGHVLDVLRESENSSCYYNVVRFLCQCLGARKEHRAYIIYERDCIISTSIITDTLRCYAMRGAT